MPATKEDWFEAERLHRAASEGDIAEMASFVNAGHGLHTFDELSRAPLHYAIEGDQYKAANWLLEHGAHVNLHNADMIGETALCLAVQRDYPEMVELLLRHGADPDISGWMSLTARIRAQRRRDSEGLEIAALIEQYRPSVRNPGGKR